MEFTTLPPEVTSALIHTGPGAESLIEASEAWQQLGANLEDSAENYGATLSSLVGTWRGASSTAMVQAVEPYVNWLRTTAQQVQQTAASAQAAASAVNSVRAAVVPVGQVSANRALLAQLLATNGFGRNLPAIAETEAEYQSMWANNSAAMTRYQAASAQASTLPQFSSPSSTTNPAGTANQSSAVSAATMSSSPTVSAATSGQSIDQPWLCRPDKWLFRFSEHVCQPVHLVRLSDQHAQLSGAEPIGPSPVRCERPDWPGRVGG